MVITLTAIHLEETILHTNHSLIKSTTNLFRHCPEEARAILRYKFPFQVLISQELIQSSTVSPPIYLHAFGILAHRLLAPSSSFYSEIRKSTKVLTAFPLSMQLTTTVLTPQRTKSSPYHVHVPANTSFSLGTPPFTFFPVCSAYFTRVNKKLKACAQIFFGGNPKNATSAESQFWKTEDRPATRIKRL